MDQHQLETRLAAARAFMDSLNQLEQTLEPSDKQLNQSEVENPQPTKVGVAADPPNSFGLDDLEQAVKDIEQFIQSQNRQSEQKEL